jgi:hypothetical protein
VLTLSNVVALAKRAWKELHAEGESLLQFLEPDATVRSVRSPK